MIIDNKLYGVDSIVVTGTNIITTRRYTMGSTISNSLGTIATGFYK